MATDSKMICPHCGIEMTHHADKVEFGVTDELIDPVFGGIVVEMHSCPKCGRTESQPA